MTSQPVIPTQARAAAVAERARIYWLLRTFGFTGPQAHALMRSRRTVFLVPVGGAR